MKKYVKVKEGTSPLGLKHNKAYKIIDACIDKNYNSGIRITIQENSFDNKDVCYDAGFFEFLGSNKNKLSN